MISLSIVRTGTKYGPEYVDRLIAGVRRHLKIGGITLLTDCPDILPEGRATDGVPVGVVNVGPLSLPGWWAKMALLNPEMRGPGRNLYIDLDTVIVGDLNPIFRMTPPRFITCSSFARAAGNLNWPCRYGSCVMLFPEGWGMPLWLQFLARRDELMKLPHGDQQAFERLIPDADLFQSFLSPRFFLNYRELRAHPDQPPEGTSMVIFGGRNKPHNCSVGWVERAWKP